MGQILLTLMLSFGSQQMFLQHLLLLETLKNQGRTTTGHVSSTTTQVSVGGTTGIQKSLLVRQATALLLGFLELQQLERGRGGPSCIRGGVGGILQGPHLSLLKRFSCRTVGSSGSNSSALVTQQK
jgi:hypothetical protein